MQHITIYTDGSCLGNPGPGGFGFLFLINGQEIYRNSGCEANTTNNQMEMTAVIQALTDLNGVKHKVDLYTDSNYVVQGATKWMTDWIKRGWTDSKGNTVKNVKLWTEIHRLIFLHDVTFHWVKAHNGDYWNEAVDTIANTAATNLKSQLENKELVTKCTDSIQLKPIELQELIKEYVVEKYNVNVDGKSVNILDQAGISLSDYIVDISG